MRQRLKNSGAFSNEATRSLRLIVAPHSRNSSVVVGSILMSVMLSSPGR